MKEILVLPFYEDSYNESDNSLDITVFISYEFKGGAVKLLPPLDISKENGYSLNPIGFDNFLPVNITDEEFLKILQNMVINSISLEPTMSSFKFLDMPNQFLAYPIEMPNKDYYISVLKMNLNLDSLEYSYSVFNIVKMNNLNTENIINYVDNTLKIDESKLDNVEKELHKIALKLQFSEYNQKFTDVLDKIVNLYVVSQPHIKKL